MNKSAKSAPGERDHRLPTGLVSNQERFIALLRDFVVIVPPAIPVVGRRRLGVAGGRAKMVDKRVFTFATEALWASMVACCWRAWAMLSPCAAIMSACCCFLSCSTN